jgi:hypothetical protein
MPMPKRKYFVLCQLSLHSRIKTSLPVIAKDPVSAVRIARGAGLIPYGVVPGK